MLMHVCVLTSASFCRRIWSLSNTSSSTALQKKKKKVTKILKYSNAFLVYVRSLTPSPAHSLKPLRSEVLVMQILSHLLEVLHVSTSADKLAIIYSDNRGQ